MITTLWFLGNAAVEAGGNTAAVWRHVGLAAAAYPLLWARVLWRLGSRHPGRGVRGTAVLFAVARALHFGLLAAVALMLLSGPAMLLSGQSAIPLFGVSPPWRLHNAPWLFAAARSAHRAGGVVIALAVGVHICGVFWHIAVERGRLDRILVPGGDADNARKGDVS